MVTQRHINFGKFPALINLAEDAELRLRSLFVKTDWICHVWCHF